MLYDLAEELANQYLNFCKQVPEAMQDSNIFWRVITKNTDLFEVSL